MFKPDFEAEAGEIIIGDNIVSRKGKQLSSNAYKVMGKTHDQKNKLSVNGTGEDVKGGNFVFSNRIGINGKSFASLAEVISRKKAKFEKPTNDYISKNTSSLNIEKLDGELEYLANAQENMKLGRYAYGGLVRFQGGGPVKPLSNDSMRRVRDAANGKLGVDKLTPSEKKYYNSINQGKKVQKPINPDKELKRIQEERKLKIEEEQSINNKRNKESKTVELQSKIRKYESNRGSLDEDDLRDYKESKERLGQLEPKAKTRVAAPTQLDEVTVKAKRPQIVVGKPPRIRGDGVVKTKLPSNRPDIIDFKKVDSAIGYKNKATFNPLTIDQQIIDNLGAKVNEDLKTSLSESEKDKGKLNMGNDDMLPLGLIGANYLSNKSLNNRLNTSVPANMMQRESNRYADYSTGARNAIKEQVGSIGANPYANLNQRIGAFAAGVKGINDINNAENNRKLEFDLDNKARNTQIDNVNIQTLNNSQYQGRDMQNAKLQLQADNNQALFSNLNEYFVGKQKRKDNLESKRLLGYGIARNRSGFNVNLDYDTSN